MASDLPLRPSEAATGVERSFQTHVARRLGLLYRETKDQQSRLIEAHRDDNRRKAQKVIMDAQLRGINAAARLLIFDKGIWEMFEKHKS